ASVDGCLQRSACCRSASGRGRAFVSSSAGLAGTPAGTLHVPARVEHWLALATRPLATIGALGMLGAAIATVTDVLLRWLAGRGLFALNKIVSLLSRRAVSPR